MHRAQLTPNGCSEGELGRVPTGDTFLLPIETLYMFIHSQRATSVAAVWLHVTMSCSCAQYITPQTALYSVAALSGSLAVI